jgi:hypothetical protein
MIQRGITGSTDDEPIYRESRRDSEHDRAGDARSRDASIAEVQEAEPTDLARIIAGLPAPMAAAAIEAGVLGRERAYDYPVEYPVGGKPDTGGPVLVSVGLTGRGRGERAPRAMILDGGSEAPTAPSVAPAERSRWAPTAPLPLAPIAAEHRVMRAAAEPAEGDGPSGPVAIEESSLPPPAAAPGEADVAEPDVDRLADDVFRILRWRLQAERERAAGWR